MTYKELAKVILDNPDQWDNNVTIYDDYENEYYPTSGCDFAGNPDIRNSLSDDVVDKGHLLICF